ncbi:hypothetical protein AB0929_28070 [Streptomyces massasporeus]|uniref:hypothetical protein n=1 Tax=Streptomyces massasporeus TaxID=67324 RepID=UPI0034079D14
MTKTYTRWTTASVILCILAMGNLAIHLITLTPQYITPLMSVLAVAAGLMGKSRDLDNSGVHIMTVRIGLGCAVFSVLLSLAIGL